MKLKQKLISAILSVMMLSGHIATLTNVAIAAGEELNGQTSRTNHANVEFNTYFEQNEHTKDFSIDEEAKLYVSVKVKNNGYLKNGIVKFSDANFEIDTEKLKSELVKESSKNEIKLQKIDNLDQENIIEVPIKIKTEEQVPANYFEKTSTSEFTATYTDENGREKAIKKEITNQANWTKTAEVELAGEISKYFTFEAGEQKGILVQARIRSGLKENSLPVSKTKLEISVPEIKISEEKTVKPERVTVTANSLDGTNGKKAEEFNETNYKYNEETNKIEIEIANQEENGQISWKKNAKDELLINYIYTGEEIYNHTKEQITQAKQTAEIIKQETEENEKRTNEDAITGEIEVKASIESYGSKEEVQEKSGKITYNIEQLKGNIIETTIMNIASEISKGYIYANYDKKEDKKETEISLNMQAQIQDKTLVDMIEIETAIEKYIDTKDEEHVASTYTKTIEISEENFIKMLGENGKIEIIDRQNNKLAEITKENYVANIEEKQINEIKIRTTKPVAEGKLELNVKKSIKAEEKYKKEEMKDFKKLVSTMVAKAYLQKEDKQVAIISSETKQTQANLIEPVSKAEISISKQNLSTIVKNEEVELRVLLDTSDSKNALFKNPSLQIILPENIETLDIKSVDLLLEDELKIKQTKVVEQNGRKIILITLEGTQTKYTDNNQEEGQNIVAKGANIVVKADITFKKLTPSSNTNIYLYYTNENTDLFEQYYKDPRKKAVGASNDTENQVGLAMANVEIVSPTGVVTENTMTGYNEEKAISNITQEKQEDIIRIYDQAHEVTIGGTILNNYENSLENVLILGRTPFKDNKLIDEATLLGSTFTMKMKERLSVQGIDQSKVKIYYSENAEATKDLITASNGWTENPSNLENVKSYLIVIVGELQKGAKISFNYKAELPANLSYNNSTYTTYKMYYDNKTETATIGEKKTAGTIGVTTGTGPEVKITLTSNMPKDESQEGDVRLLPAKGAARFWVDIENTGKMEATNASILIDVPEGANIANYEEEKGVYNLIAKEIKIGTLKAGEKKQISYYLLAPKVEHSHSYDHEDEESPEIGIKATQVSLSADNITGAIKSEEFSFKILPAQFTIINKTNTKETELYSSKDIITYEIKMKDNEDDCNLTVTVPLPSGAKIVDAYWNEGEKYAGIEKQNGRVIAKGFFTGDSGFERNLTVKFQVKDDTKMNFSTKVYAEVERSEQAVEKDDNAIKQIYSNEQYIYIDKPGLTGSQKAPQKTYVKENEEFYYNFIVKASEKGHHDNFVLEDTLPSEVTVLNTKVEFENQGENSFYDQIESVKQDGNKLTITIPKLYRGDILNIKIKVKAKLASEQEDEKQIVNKARIYSNQVQAIELNSVKQYVEYDEKAHTGNKGDPDNNTTGTASRYKITGVAWLDSNKNGKRDDDEELLSGIRVLLIYKSNSNVVKDQDTNKQKITTTNKDGYYEFTNLAKGEYLVVFLYDASRYNVTKYQAQGVEASYNSDAINMKIVLDQKEQFAVITDTIKITSSNSRDIDIGLYVAEKFDLRLDKYITKITMNTPNGGTKVYNYKDSKITKRELLGKDVGQSTAVIEYKIVVTNEGAVAGYARKIADYLPDTSKFNTEINKDWYLSKDQKTVFNASLAETLLKPGESKELKLVLNYNITNKNIGTAIENQAEIYESYNEQGLKDFDSEVANKVETEDDMSIAKVVFSIATGKIILYVSLTIAIIVILGIGIFEIRKRVIRNK